MGWNGRSVVLGLSIALMMACAPDLVGPVGGGKFAAPAASQSSAPRIYIVKFRDDVRIEEVTWRRFVESNGGRWRFSYRHTLHGFAAELPDAAVAALERNPNVEYVESDGVASLHASPPWGLDRIDQRNLPLDAAFSPPNGGAGVHAYIIDTGIRRTHNDFGGRAEFGVDFSGLGDGDCHGHGTHVAGTVGGTEYGVAKAVTLVAVRVFGCTGQVPWSIVIAAVDWVTANAQKPAVANMSLGGPYAQALNDAVTASIASGVVYAISAGNSTRDACLQSPASTPDALTIGASDANDFAASFSNFGPCLDLYAPGVDVLSAGNGCDNCTQVFSGTSMSAPHVAGAAALILSANPFWSSQQVASAMTGSATPGVIVGAGSSPNRLLFVDWTQAAPPPPPPPPDDASFTVSCSANYCTFRSTVMQNGTWYFSDWGIENPGGIGPVYARPMSTHDPVTLKSPYTTTVRHVVGSQERIGYVRCNRNFKCQPSF